MAIKYYDLNAATNGNGDYETPYNNRNNAQSAAGVNGSIVLKNGDYDFASHLDFDDAATDRSESRFGATLKTNSDTTRIARVSSNGATMSGDATQTVSGFVFDAPNSTSNPARCLELSQNSPFTGVINVNSCKFIAGSVTGLYVDIRNSTINITDCEFEGGSAQGEIYGTSSLSSVADQSINVVSCKFTSAASVNTQGAKVTKANSNTHTLDTTFRNCTFNAAPTGSATYTGLNLKVASATVSGCTFDLDGSDAASMGAVYVIGQTTAQITEAYISNNTVTSSGKSGYLLSLGATAITSNVTGGFVEANHVKGTYFTSFTPHGILLGMDSTGGVVRNNVVENIYAGILASKCTSGEIKNNLLYNCYGPSLYVKGTTDITVTDNTVVVAQDCTNSGNEGIAPIAVNEQVDGTDTAGCTIENNTVIIPDISFVQGLASVSLNQTASFKSNTYIIPDTVDLNDPLFCVGAASLSDNAPNTTIAEWNALSSTANGTGSITVGNDVIIQLPASQIADLVGTYKPVPSGVSGTGAATIISNNIISR